MCIGLTPKQKKFVEKYIETKNAYKSYLYAFPSSQKWKRAAVDSQACILLKTPKVVSKIQAAELAAQKKLEKSIILNKKKILKEIIELTEKTKKQEGQTTVNLQALKLLSQISGLLTENKTEITINNNNQTVNEVIGYLDL